MLYSNNDIILQSEGGGGKKRPNYVWPLKLFTYQKYSETMIKYVDEEHVSTKTADAEFNCTYLQCIRYKKQLPQVRNY